MAVDDVREILRRSGLRVTPQRRAILAAFRGGSSEHLSADEVLSRASAAVPEIGRGTVYATLAELSELGLLTSVGSPEPVRYETNLEPHDHFRCRLCLRLFDIDLGGRRIASRTLKTFTIERITLIGDGVCGECHEYQRGLSEGVAQILDRPLLRSAALSDIACARVQSPLGELALGASSDGIVRIAFADHADFDTLVLRARRRQGPTSARVHLNELDHSLQRYFDGDHAPMTAPVDWRLSSEGASQALGAVARITYDHSRSYERIMDQIGPRECGRTIGANPVPVLIPCHRVSCGSRRPEVFVGGPARLQILRGIEAK